LRRDLVYREEGGSQERHGQQYKLLKVAMSSWSWQKSGQNSQESKGKQVRRRLIIKKGSLEAWEQLAWPPLEKQPSSLIL